MSRQGNNISLVTELERANLGYQVLDADDELGVSWQVYLAPVTIMPYQRLVAVAHRLGC